MRNKIRAIGTKLLPKNLYSRLTLMTTVTIIAGYFVVYAAWTTINPVNTGDTLTKDLINNILSNANDLNDRVSNFSFSSGNVGIGAANPEGKLDVGDLAFPNGTISGAITPTRLIVNGTSNTSPALTLGYYSSGYGLDMWIGDTGLAPVYFDQRSKEAFIFRVNTSIGPTEVMRINGWNSTAGNVGIGTPTPSQKLEVMGTVLADAHTTHSDIRYKKDITTLADSLDKLMKIRGVRFLWRDSDKSQNPQFGVIAQEVEKEFPEVVTTNQDGYKSVAYDKLVAPLIEAVKEQQKQIEELKGKIERLENR